MANPDITAILASGDAPQLSPEDAARVFAAAYEEIREIAVRRMRHERSDHTLQPTALVNEVFLRLVDPAGIRAESRAQFLAIAARAMRQVLVDHARSRQAEKRGGRWRRVLLEGDDLAAPGAEIEARALEDALVRLAERSERMARGVELRIFGGLTGVEVARTLGISRKTAVEDWRFACLWLRSELAGESPP